MVDRGGPDRIPLDDPVEQPKDGKRESNCFQAKAMNLMISKIDLQIVTYLVRKLLTFLHYVSIKITT